MNIALVRIDSNIFPFLPDSFMAKTINVNDSAITIQRIGIISGCTLYNYIKFKGGGLQEGVENLIYRITCAYSE